MTFFKSFFACPKILVLIQVYLCICTAPGHAQSGDIRADTAALRVGFAGNPPFITDENNDLGGISFEIWQALAAQAQWRYTTKYFDNVSGALDSLQQGKLDIVVGPISITANRMDRMQLSQPYYQSSLSIMSRAEELTFWGRIAPFFSMKLLVALLVFLFILGVVGTLIWIAERKESPEQFPNDPLNGIANGMWLAIVTMTTTGYGDRAPITLWGRIITGSWMVISIVFATSMVAGIASTLTLSAMGKKTITKVEELSGKKVATIKNTPAASFVNTYHAKEVDVADVEEGYRKLKNKEVDAIVYDRPALLYFQKTFHDPDVQISNAQYYKQGYGFAMPLNSTLVREVNINLLELAEQKRVERIVEEWLGHEGE